MNKEKLIELKESMELLEVRQNEIRDKRLIFEKENAELIEHINQLNMKISDCKDILRENAEVGYLQDGQKKRLGGIGIRILKTLEYDDLVALKWAKEKDLFLSLDKKAFENVAKTGELDFVELSEKVTVTFPAKIVLEN